MTTEANVYKTATLRLDGIAVTARVRTAMPWVLTVSLSGYLDIKNTPAFARTIEQVLNESPHITHIVFDLGCVTYISSTGIGAFTQILVSTKNLNTEMTLYKPHDNVRLAFEALGFASFFSIVDDEKKLANRVVPGPGAFN